MPTKKKVNDRLIQTRVSDDVFAFVKREAEAKGMSAATWLRVRLIEMCARSKGM